MFVLDTNVILEYKKLKLSSGGHKLAITKPCLLEVKRISEEKRDSALLEIANKLEVIETMQKNADNSIIEAAKTHKLKVITFDKELIRKLAKENIPVISSYKDIQREFNLT